MKYTVKIQAPQGDIYLYPGGVIASIAKWFRSEHHFLVKAAALESVPFMLMPTSVSPHYYASEDEALCAVENAGREVALLQAWAKMADSELFGFIGSTRLGNFDPAPVPYIVEPIDIPKGYHNESASIPAWHVATFYEDQGYLFLEEGQDKSIRWIKGPSEGAAWASSNEEEALRKSKMITRTESVYAYPRFCEFT